MNYEHNRQPGSHLYRGTIRETPYDALKWSSSAERAPNPVVRLPRAVSDAQAAARSFGASNAVVDLFGVWPRHLALAKKLTCAPALGANVVAGVGLRASDAQVAALAKKLTGAPALRANLVAPKPSVTLPAVSVLRSPDRPHHPLD